MKRGISLGNALDTAPDDPAALTIEARHLDAVQAAGLDTVRLPVRWSAHASNAPPYTIDPAFFDGVDHVIDLVEQRQLDVVVNVHHYDELCADPPQHAVRLVALWTQIAARYADRSPALRFELLNEPTDAMSAHRWNQLLPAVLAAVRASNPNRQVVVGPAAMNSIAGLGDLVLPADDQLIVTIHYYLPFPFTHQGAPWWPGADAWIGATWGTRADHDTVDTHLATAASWARERGHDVLVGEFGTYERAESASRMLWTRAVRVAAERMGMAWCYWDFGTDFGAYDVRARAWREPLRAALLDD